MYGLCGISLNIENIFKIAAPFNQNLEIETTDDLKLGYLKFLQDLHSEIPINFLRDPIIRDRTVAKELIKAFAFSKINDLEQDAMVAHPFSGKEFESRAKSVQLALTELKQLNSEVFELFQL